MKKSHVTEVLLSADDRTGALEIGGLRSVAGPGGATIAELFEGMQGYLGLEALPPGCSLGTDFTDQASPLPAAERLHKLAEAHRLDVRAAQQAVEEAAAELARQRGRVARVFNVGAAAEKEGDWSVGPAVRLELPVFDQNQAQIARQQHRLRFRWRGGQAKARRDLAFGGDRAMGERRLLRMLDHQRVEAAGVAQDTAHH